MNYKGIKYHKISNSTIIFYEIDNHINSDNDFFKKLKILLEIVKNNKPKHLIINRIGAKNIPSSSIMEIKDFLLIEDFKKYGLDRIFLIESENERNFSPFSINSDFVKKFDNMLGVFDHIKQAVLETSMSI